MQFEEFWPQLGELWSINVYASEFVFPWGEGAGLPCSCAKSHAWEHVWLSAPVGKGVPVASSEKHWSAWNSPERAQRGEEGKTLQEQFLLLSSVLRQETGSPRWPCDINQGLFPSERPNKTLLRSNGNAVNKLSCHTGYPLGLWKRENNHPMIPGGKRKPFLCPAQSPLFFNIIKCFSAKCLKVAYWVIGILFTCPSVTIREILKNFFNGNMWAEEGGVTATFKYFGFFHDHLCCSGWARFEEQMS